MKLLGVFKVCFGFKAIIFNFIFNEIFFRSYNAMLNEILHISIFKDLQRGITLAKVNKEFLSTELWTLTCIFLLWYVINLFSFKQIPVLVFEIFKNMLKLKNIISVNFYTKCNLDLQEGNGLHEFCTLLT